MVIYHVQSKKVSNKTNPRCQHFLRGSFLAWVGSPCQANITQRPETIILRVQPLVADLVYQGSDSQPKQGNVRDRSCYVTMDLHGLIQHG